MDVSDGLSDGAMLHDGIGLHSPSSVSSKRSRKGTPILRSTIEEVTEKFNDIECELNKIKILIEESDEQKKIDPDFLLVEEILELQEGLQSAQEKLKTVQRVRSRRSSAAEIMQVANSAQMKVSKVCLLPDATGGLFDDPQSREEVLLERGALFQQLRDESKKKLEEVVTFIDEELADMAEQSNSSSTIGRAERERMLKMYVNFPGSKRASKPISPERIVPVRSVRRGPKFGVSRFKRDASGSRSARQKRTDGGTQGSNASDKGSARSKGDGDTARTPDEVGESSGRGFGEHGGNQSDAEKAKLQGDEQNTEGQSPDQDERGDRVDVGESKEEKTVENDNVKQAEKHAEENLVEQDVQGDDVQATKRNPEEKSADQTEGVEDAQDPEDFKEKTSGQETEKNAEEKYTEEKIMESTRNHDDDVQLVSKRTEEKLEEQSAETKEGDREKQGDHTNRVEQDTEQQQESSDASDLEQQILKEPSASESLGDMNEFDFEINSDPSDISPMDDVAGTDLLSEGGDVNDIVNEVLTVDRKTLHRIIRPLSYTDQMENGGSELTAIKSPKQWAANRRSSRESKS